MRSVTHPLVVLMLASGLSHSLAAQNGVPAHAPDGRAPEYISPLYFAPKPNAPFTATAKTLWVRTLPDGSVVTRQNARLVTRDAEGRIFQQRVTFVPVPNTDNSRSWIHATDYYDPLDHTHYHCDTVPKVCNLFAYFDPVTDEVAAAGLHADKTRFLTRENLGVDTFAGLDVKKSRETTTLYRESIGNTQTILRTVDYWYSPALGVNVQVKRHDPRDGDQTLWLTDMSLAAPDPETFKVPADYRIIDHRVSAAPPAGAEGADPQ